VSERFVRIHLVIVSGFVSFAHLVIVIVGLYRMVVMIVIERGSVVARGRVGVRALTSAFFFGGRDSCAGPICFEA
jgi:hypothetical protein